MKTKTVPAAQGELLGLHRFPSYPKSLGITCIRRVHAGRNALPVQCGNHIYDVSADPYIYFNEAR